MILACDTSSVVCSVALGDGNEILWEKSETGGQIHIAKLSPLLKEALQYAKSREGELEALAIAIGPGSFNGLRIGLATMKGLAVSLGLPIIPIPTTDGMAYELKAKLSGVARAVIYSHRNFVHFADYDFTASPFTGATKFHYDEWKHLHEDRIDHYFGKIDRGFEIWLQNPEASKVKAKFIEMNASASSIALLAAKRMHLGLTDLDELEPLYNAVYEAKKWVPPQF